ncbi:TPA: hypothetical protein ACSP3W_004130 [Aeromonas veronii]
MSKTVFAIKECPDFVFCNRDWNKVIVAGSMEEAKEELAEQMYEDNPDSVLSDKDRIYEASGMIEVLTQKQVLEAAEKGEDWPIKHELVKKVRMDD